VVGTSTCHYKPRRRGQADLEQRIKEIAETRMRYGYRLVHVAPQREGWITNIKRTYRLYTALGLQLRNRTPKRRVKAKLREDRCPAVQPMPPTTCGQFRGGCSTDAEIEMS
jgi:putative transposase